MYKLQWKTMVKLQPQSTTDRNAPMLLAEEDERERVLLVVVRRAGDSTASDFKAPGAMNALGCKVPGASNALGLEVPGASNALNAPNAVGSPNESLTYAMPVGLVREVIGARTVTRVPGTPAVMRGLVNVRGMVVTVLDLATCLVRSGGETAARTEMPGSIVLLEHCGRLVGLAVESVRDVRPLDDVGLGADGNAFRDEHVFVRGLASAGGELVTLLDVAALLARHLISLGET